MKTNIGIDVSKRFFDLHILEDNKDMHFEYTAAAVAKCVKLLSAMEVVLIVMEATGGYETNLAAQLQAAALPVAVVNPRRIRDFAKAAGFLAKTDKIDSHVIAQFAAKLQPPADAVINANTAILRALVARRKQLFEIRTAEHNRMEHAFGKEVICSIKVVLRTLDKEIEKVDKQIGEHIDQEPELKQRAEILKSTPGIGQTTASMLVVALPELGRANKKEIAALVGLAPMNRDSGMSRGKRMTGGGRRDVRSRLFMPMLVAIRHNPVIRKYYRHLLDQGKPKMAAIIASMRKLLVILNTMLKNRQRWQPQMA